MTIQQAPTHPDELAWFAASGVQPVVYVAKLAGKPVAILQFHPGVGFELTTCSGRLVGRYATLVDGQAALSELLAAEHA